MLTLTAMRGHHRLPHLTAACAAPLPLAELRRAPPAVHLGRVVLFGLKGARAMPALPHKAATRWVIARITQLEPITLGAHVRALRFHALQLRARVVQTLALRVEDETASAARELDTAVEHVALAQAAPAHAALRGTRGRDRLRLRGAALVRCFVVRALGEVVSQLLGPARLRAHAHAQPQLHAAAGAHPERGGDGAARSIDRCELIRRPRRRTVAPSAAARADSRFWRLLDAGAAADPGATLRRNPALAGLLGALPLRCAELRTLRAVAPPRLLLLLGGRLRLLGGRQPSLFACLPDELA